MQPTSVKDIRESFRCELALPRRIEWVKGSRAQQDAVSSGKGASCQTRSVEGQLSMEKAARTWLQPGAESEQLILDALEAYLWGKHHQKSNQAELQTWLPVIENLIQVLTSRIKDLGGDFNASNMDAPAERAPARSRRQPLIFIKQFQDTVSFPGSLGRQLWDSAGPVLALMR